MCYPRCCVNRMVIRADKRLSVLQIILVLAWVMILSCCTTAKNSLQDEDWAPTAADRYNIFPDITYLSVNGRELKLDVYKPHHEAALVPVAVYFHGGGWTSGDKADSTLQLLPYLKMGWGAINVNYRLASVAIAPAALEDCRCALRWIFQNAGKYGFDSDRLVLTGRSSGGYLALMTGIVTESAGYDTLCPGGGQPISVAAIVNWFGITDVADLLSGRHSQSFADEWLGNQSDRRSLATRLSPLSYLRKDLPPIITIHGDADPTVPYSQATKLHGELSRLGVVNQLLTIRGGKHGWFTAEEDRNSYAVIRAFLANCGLQATITD
jgi:acetyl esterase/lipase